MTLTDVVASVPGLTITVRGGSAKADMADITAMLRAITPLFKVNLSCFMVNWFW